MITMFKDKVYLTFCCGVSFLQFHYTLSTFFYLFVCFPFFTLHLRNFRKTGYILIFVMAVIQTIRDKYAKLAGGVIVLALVGFILMDATSGSSGGLFRKSTAVGSINGDKIDYTEYDAAIRNREEEMKRQNPDGTIDEMTQAQLRDQVWMDLVNSRLMKDVEEKLGITVGKSELNDLLTGPNPDPVVRQTLANRETGIFNPQEAASIIAQVKRDPTQKAAWEAFEADVVKRRYTSKFNALVAGSVYIPKFILDDQNDARNSFANINYVKLPYASIPDDKVKVTDDEIRKYMEKHKVMFQIKEGSRGIEYVAFNIVPSSEDSAAVFNELERLKAEFAEAKDVEAFVNRNSNTPFPITYYSRTQLESLPNPDELLNAPVNSITGPFYDGHNYMLAKIEDKKLFPDSVTVRHILVKTKDKGLATLSDSAAKARIDSAAALVKAGMPFDSVVVRYSDDYSTENPNISGEYTFTLPQKPQISTEFGDFAFEGQAGSSKIVKVDNDSYSGYHYIEIIRQSPASNVAKIAFISKELNVSSNTNSALYAQATQFANKANNAAAFEKTAKEMSVTTARADGISENSFLVNGLGSSRELVKWLYESDMGTVSPIFNVGDKYVVAKVNNILPAGLAPINEQTRPILEGYVRKSKKAQMLLDRTKGKNSLEAIAQAEQQTVGTADSINLAQGFIPGLGNEPKVAGYAFCKSFKENTLSPGVAGNDGVYYIKVSGRITASATGERNLPVERQMIEYSLKNSAANMIMNTMKESAKVEDRRAKIY